MVKNIGSKNQINSAVNSSSITCWLCDLEQVSWLNLFLFHRMKIITECTFWSRCRDGFRNLPSVLRPTPWILFQHQSWIKWIGSAVFTPNCPETLQIQSCLSLRVLWQEMGHKSVWGGWWSWGKGSKKRISCDTHNFGGHQQERERATMTEVSWTVLLKELEPERRKYGWNY